MTVSRFLEISAIAAIGILASPATVQSAETNGANPPLATTANRTQTLTHAKIYLINIDGRWTASLTGDLNEPNTELIEVMPSNKSARVLAKPLPDGRPQCLTKMKDRREFGYLECNSAFYSVNAVSAAAGTLIRGVLSLGILTAADAAYGNTAFRVSLDQAALDAAVRESNAFELAEASAPVIAYREAFAKAQSSQQLRDFISRFENTFDPDGLVITAKAKLPDALALEEAREKREAAVAAQQAEAARNQKIQRQAEEEALNSFRAKLKPGDFAAANCRVFQGCKLRGMVIEVKQPIVFMQWENATPAQQWVHVETLAPLRR